MITTVCMNPSFDKTASVKALKPGELNRLCDVRVDVGGKGVNVAVVLKRLGVPVGCVGCLGERGRESFLKMIRQEDVPFDYLPMPGEVRTNLKLVDESTRTVTEFNEPGISMNQSQLEDFLNLLKEKSEKSDYVVLSGRLPEGCEETTYQRCLKVLEGKRCVLDCAGETLLHGIKEKPFLIKPNLPEIEAIMEKRAAHAAGPSGRGAVSDRIWGAKRDYFHGKIWRDARQPPGYVLCSRSDGGSPIHCWRRRCDDRRSAGGAVARGIA